MCLIKYCNFSVKFNIPIEQTLKIATAAAAAALKSLSAVNPELGRDNQNS